jgi:hypothetical protein
MQLSNLRNLKEKRELLSKNSKCMRTILNKSSEKNELLFLSETMPLEGRLSDMKRPSIPLAEKYSLPTKKNSIPRIIS